MLCINNPLSETVCGTKKDPLIWVDIYTCPDKNSLGGYYAYEVAFGTNPEILLFVNYTIWNPI